MTIKVLPCSPPSFILSSADLLLAPYSPVLIENGPAHLPLCLTSFVCLISSLQSKLGHLTLFICTAHGYIYGWNKFLRLSTYKWYTPPGYMLCLIVPSVVLVLKLLLLLPCMDRTLTRIRQGWERVPPRKEGHMNPATNL